MPDYILGIELGTSKVKVDLLELSQLKLNIISEKSYDATFEHPVEKL